MVAALQNKKRGQTAPHTDSSIGCVMVYHNNLGLSNLSTDALFESDNLKFTTADIRVLSVAFIFK
ncbi:hypothetical protein A6U96_04680 [Agrobacterium tumefaciens]|nr:hypothetical protein A6U96_04680 [Agrobacterium tumefaciens]